MTKEIIVDAAKTAFGKYGYKKTTLEDISSLTNRGKTAIYYYFKNKDEIFIAVVKQEAEKMKKALQKAIKSEGKPVDKFKVYVYTRMAYLEQIANYYSGMKSELLEQLPFINQNRIELDLIEMQIIAGLINEGQKNGDFEIADVQNTAQTILTVLKSLEVPFFGRLDDYDYKPELNNLMQLLLNGLIKR